MFFFWVWFCNLGILALSICILIGGRSPSEAQYSIINWPRSTLTLIWGDECANATADIVPDVYKLGSSGACRVFAEGNTRCNSHFPPSINLAREILLDFDRAEEDFAVDDLAVLTQCRETIDKPFIEHGKADQLGKVLAGFLITTALLCVFSSLTAFVDMGIGWFSSPILVLDMVLIFGELVMIITLINLEGGGYLTGIHASKFSDREMMGIAIWMSLAMLGARVLTSPWTLVIALFVILPIMLVVFFVVIRTRGFMWILRTYARSQIEGAGEEEE